MNVFEGGRRIQTAGKVLVTFAFAVFLTCLVVCAFAYFTHGSSTIAYDVMPVLFPFSLLPAILGASLFVAGWIVTGFGTPPGNNSSDD